MIQKISSGQTFTGILNLSCDLDLKCSNPIFPQGTPAYDAVLPTQFGCKLTGSFEDTPEIVIVLSYKASLWPWHWKQWTNFSAWHSGWWYCISIPGLVTKCSVAQKISSRQTFLTFTVTLTLNKVIQFFHWTLQLLMLYYQTKLCCQQTSSLEDSRNSHIMIM